MALKAKTASSRPTPALLTGRAARGVGSPREHLHGPRGLAAVCAVHSGSPRPGRGVWAGRACQPGPEGRLEVWGVGRTPTSGLKNTRGMWRRPRPWSTVGISGGQNEEGSRDTLESCSGLAPALPALLYGGRSGDRPALCMLSGLSQDRSRAGGEWHPPPNSSSVSRGSRALGERLCSRPLCPRAAAGPCVCWRPPFLPSPVRPATPVAPVATTAARGQTRASAAAKMQTPHCALGGRWTLGMRPAPDVTVAVARPRPRLHGDQHASRRPPANCRSAAAPACAWRCCGRSEPGSPRPLLTCRHADESLKSQAVGSGRVMGIPPLSG